MIKNSRHLQPYSKRFTSSNLEYDKTVKYSITISQEDINENYSFPIVIYNVDRGYINFDVPALKKLYKAIGEILEVE